MALTKEQTDKLIELFNAGDSHKEIAEKTGIYVKAISKYIKDNNLTRQPRSKRKCSDEDIAIMIEKYNSGMTCKEIGEAMGYNEKSVNTYLKASKCEMRDHNRIIDYDKFDELHKQGLSDTKIAEALGCAKSTVRNCRQRLNKKGAGYVKITTFAESHKDVKLSYMQKQMILGSLLGDLNLIKVRDRNSKISIVHCKAQKDLFLKKVEILGEFMGSYNLYDTVDERTGNTYSSYRGSSYSHNEFTEIRNILYIDNAKTVTKEYLDMIEHPIALAYWFMDDGTNRGYIATMGFGREEVELLSSWLFEKFKISNHVTKNGDIYIEAKSRKLFDSLISPYIIESMKYKLKFK